MTKFVCKGICYAMTVISSSQALAGVYLEGNPDIYTTRSEEVSRYERVFNAGKKAGENIIIQNNVIQPPAVPDLRNPRAEASYGTEPGQRAYTDKVESEHTVSTNEHGSSIDTQPEKKILMEKKEDYFKSMLAKGPLNIDPYDPDKVKNEWISVSHMGNTAGTIHEIASSIMPVGWRVDVRYANREDMFRTFDFSGASHRDDVIAELLKDTGYTHKYFFEHMDTNKNVPLLIIHPEGK